MVGSVCAPLLPMVHSPCQCWQQQQEGVGPRGAHGPCRWTPAAVHGSSQLGKLHVAAGSKARLAQFHRAAHGVGGAFPRGASSLKRSRTTGLGVNAITQKAENLRLRPYLVSPGCSKRSSCERPKVTPEICGRGRAVPLVLDSNRGRLTTLPPDLTPSLRQVTSLAGI